MVQLLDKIPRVSVKIVFRNGDKVLYYKTKKGIRDVPGGHINFGESIFEALKRELNEEIGFNLQITPKLIHAWTYLSSDRSMHRVYIGFLLDLPEAIQFKSKEFGDNIEYIWLNKKEIKNNKFLPEMEELLLKAANNSK